ncbi:MAG: acyltransferase [Frankiales bacterium]|nr:acyltransferase [Frankiales bacterium]
MLRKARKALGVVRDLSSLDEDVRQGIYAMGRVVSAEHVVARRSPTISTQCTISPLASLRFVERVSIGDRANVGPYCCVWGGWSTAWARVGVGALLSPGVVLVAGNHGTEGTGPVRDEPLIELDVEVGDGAWIGAHATIVGCRVGRGAVVGASAVVLEDVPDFAIAVGAPAKVIGYRKGAPGA